MAVWIPKVDGVDRILAAHINALQTGKVDSDGTASPTFVKQTLRATSPGEATFGPNLLTNGNFATNDFTGWTAGLNWSAATGVAKRTAAAPTTLVQAVNLTISESYRITLTTSLRTAGTLALTFGALPGSYQVGANGAHIWTFRAAATAAYNLTFTPDAAFDGAVDNVTVELIIGNATPLADYYDSASDLAASLRLNYNIGTLAFGRDALRKTVVGNVLYVSDAGFNTAYGIRAGMENTVGAQNVFFGYQAGQSNTTGYHNTFVGIGAGQGNETGFYNIYIGADAGLVATGTANIFIGVGAGHLATSNQNVIIGANSTALTAGGEHVLVGYLAGSDNIVGSQTVFVGAQAGYHNTATQNVGVGYQAMMGTSPITGTGNVAVGPLAMNLLSSGINNIAIGNSSMSAIVTGAENIAIGTNAFGNLTSAGYAVAIGYHAAQLNTTGAEIVAIGRDALSKSITGGYLVAIGSGALKNISDVNCGIAIGWLAGAYETLGNKLFIDGLNRVDEAGGRSKSLIYGIYDALPANQHLTINGHLGQSLAEIPIAVNNAAAAAAGCLVGEFYRSNADPSVVYVRTA